MRSALADLVRVAAATFALVAACTIRSHTSLALAQPTPASTEVHQSRESGTCQQTPNQGGGAIFDPAFTPSPLALPGIPRDPESGIYPTGPVETVQAAVGDMQHPAYWIQAGWIKPVPDWDIDEPVRFTQVLAPGQPVATEVYWEGNGWAAWDDEEYWFVFEENGYWGYWVQYHGTWYIVAELPDSYMGFSNAESLCFFGETTTSRAQLGGSASLPVQVGVLAIATNGGQVGPYTPNFTETPAFPDLHSCNFFSNTSGNLYNWTGRTQDGSGPQSCSGEDDLGVTYTQHANWQATSFCNFYPDQGELGCASGGGWTYTNDNNPNGGARAVYAFDAGTNIGGVNYCYTKANDMGKANVYIDGQFARTVDLSSSKGQSQGWSQWIEWGRCDFFYTPPGIHIIEVEETGIPGALTLFGQLPYINVDVFLAQ